MSENSFASRSRAQDSAMADGPVRLVAPDEPLSARPAVAPAGDGEQATLAPREREQLERDFAEIERVAAILREAEPALESFTRTPPAAGKPHSLWPLIVLLWISSALLAAVSAVIAFAIFVG